MAPNIAILSSYLPSKPLISLESSAEYLAPYIEKLQQHGLSDLPTAAASLLPTGLKSLREPARPPGKTAWLDGFRGYAAFTVAILHMVMEVFPNSNFAYNGYPGRDYLMQMPFLRLLYGGQVGRFFIISGYVLSLGTLKKMRSQAYGALQLDLSSKIFRRGLRLYLPAIAVTIFPCLFSYYHIFPDVPRWDDNMPYRKFDMIAPQDTLYKQLSAWLWSIPPTFYPFDWNNTSQNSPWAYQTWTIPVEFRCSMVLFLIQAAFARFTSRARLTLVAIIGSLMMLFWRWEVFLYIGGSFFAELDLIQDEREAQSLPSAHDPEKESSLITPTSSTSRSKSTFLPWLILLFSLFAISTPGGKDETDAWWVHFFWNFVPPTYKFGGSSFWDTVGTFTLLWAMRNLPSVQRFWSRPFWLYLGKISFSLYLTHTIALKMFLYPLLPYVWFFTGYQTDFSYTIGFLIAATVTMALELWIAELFLRFVEQPAADFTQWLDRRLARPIN